MRENSEELQSFLGPYASRCNCILLHLNEAALPHFVMNFRLSNCTEMACTREGGNN